MTKDLFALLDAHALLDWPAIRYALENQEKLPDTLSRDDLVSFATGCLAKIDACSPGFAEIANLTLDCPNSREEMFQRVAEICIQIGLGDDAIAPRKWRAAELEWTLNNLSGDAVYALVEVATFWTKWGWPADAPASMQLDRSNDYLEYGSDAQLKSTVDEHRAWLNTELSQLERV